MLAQLLVPPEQPVARGLLESQRCRDPPVDLRRRVLPVQINLLWTHPVHVELGEAERVVDLGTVRK